MWTNRSGFRLECRVTEHRQLGRNEVPVAAWLDELADALALIGKRREAERFARLLAATHDGCPALVAWLAKRPLAALEHAGEWPQVPITLRLRFLDPACAIVPGGDGPPLMDIALTSAALAALNPPVERVFMTENETNFLAFPPAPGSLVLFGAGYGIGTLAGAQWLRERALHYWGDIDTHGFAILDQLRGYAPHAQSFLMDRATLLAHGEHWSREASPVTRDLPRLTADEAALYDELRMNRLGTSVRLEQERIGFATVQRTVLELARGMGGC